MDCWHDKTRFFQGTLLCHTGLPQEHNFVARSSGGSTCGGLSGSTSAFQTLSGSQVIHWNALALGFEDASEHPDDLGLPHSRRAMRGVDAHIGRSVEHYWGPTC